MTNAKDLAKDSYPWVRDSDTLSHAIGSLKDEASAEALVFTGKRLSGIFSPASIIRSKINFTQAKVRSFARPVPNIDAGEEPEEVARIMLASNYSLLPVIDREYFAGAINMLDLVDYFAGQNNSASLRKVRNGNSAKKVISLKETDKFGTAIHAFHNSAKRHILLMDSNGAPSELLTPYDLMRNIGFHSHRRDNSGRARTQTRAFKANLPDMDALPLSNFVNHKTQFMLHESQTVKDAVAAMRGAGRLGFLARASEETYAMSARDLLSHYIGMAPSLFKGKRQTGTSTA